MDREIRCIVCGGEKPFFRRKYCNRCAPQMKLKHSRDKKKEFRQTLKDYDKEDRLDYKKVWRERHRWNEYMREYRRKHPERIRGQNRTASKKYRNRARQ